MRSSAVRLLLILFAALIGGATGLRAAEPIDFVRDVQPILTARCLNCHGPVRQESDYRVDVRQIAIQGGANYAPNILPGRSADSPFFQFVTGQVEDMLMPAKGERLTREEIDILRRWIDQGASWPDSATRPMESKLDWWSLQPLAAPAPPAPVDGFPAAHSPIDAFVHSELAARSLTPSPRAAKPQLLRRLTFDLIGLPPTPEEIDAFVQATEPDAYERVVDRLLASPRHGERWARHWMDAAHFAETHGHDQDRIREHAWPYRDYLIEAFNRDGALIDFVRDQLAADVFSPDEPRRAAALGFLAAGPWDESTLRDIREDTLDREIGRYVDRDDMLTNVMSNFVSLTVQCARCHDHKFDPISQSDYYALQAVFAGVERANRRYDEDPSIAIQRERLLRRQRQLAEPNDALRSELLSDPWQTGALQWESELAGHQRWAVLQLSNARSTDGSTLTIQPHDGSVLASGTRPERDTYELTGEVAMTRITGVRLEVLSDPSLPHAGPGRQDNGNLHLTEIEVVLESGRRLGLRNPQADFDQAGWGIARAIDNKDETAWGIYPKVGQAHEAVFEFDEPVELTKAMQLTVRLKQLHGAGHLIGKPRVSFTDARPPLHPVNRPADIVQILGKMPQLRSEEERFQLALYWQRQTTERLLAELPKQKLVYAAAADFEPDGSLKPPPGPRPIHILARGDIRTPRELALPGSLTCIPNIVARFDLDEHAPESARRAALANWLTEPRNPLLWRSIINRNWQHHFSRGLVESVNDFGRLGALPSHPGLLEWLAEDFRDSGQSLKRLHRLIVCSETYRQSALDHESISNNERHPRRDQARELDSDNRMLWRMHRVRLDAECVRDSMLCCSGQLDLRMGGPSDRHFDLKPGRHVTPIIDYSLFDLDSPLGQRRGVYRFLFRTLPDPFMEALDCPAGDQITPTRNNSVTVQQALAVWNDAFVLKQTQHMASRLERQAADVSSQVRLAIRLALGREPHAEEWKRYVEYTERHGLANCCRLIFNTNEFMYVE